MIINKVAQNVETIIAVDTAKNSFQVLVVNQKTGKKKKFFKNIPYMYFITLYLEITVFF